MRAVRRRKCEAIALLLAGALLFLLVLLAAPAAEGAAGGSSVWLRRLVALHNAVQMLLMLLLVQLLLSERKCARCRVVGLRLRCLRGRVRQQPRGAVGGVAVLWGQQRGDGL